MKDEFAGGILLQVGNEWRIWDVGWGAWACFRSVEPELWGMCTRTGFPIPVRNRCKLSNLSFGPRCYQYSSL